MGRIFYWQSVKVIKLILLSLIHSYRYLISPFLPPSCRFQVGCSKYAEIVIKKYGIIKGLVLVVNRLLRCQGIWISRR